MKSLHGVVLLLAAFLALGACGITAPNRGPGYADMDLPRSGLTRDTSLSIGPRVLGFAARHANEGPETRAMLEALEGVRVRVYRVDDDAQLSRLHEQVTLNADRLQERAWQPVLRVVETDLVLHMLVLQDNEELLGLALVSLDREELVFINVMGRLSPDILRELSTAAALTAVDEAAAASGDS
ncbi:MAG: DUF4252 domain-containing protein [Halieaceae bacterium]|nr:DUF4252 domain-containing protein [Halieaceae bacterium]